MQTHGAIASDVGQWSCRHLILNMSARAAHCPLQITNAQIVNARSGSRRHGWLLDPVNEKDELYGGCTLVHAAEAGMSDGWQQHSIMIPRYVVGIQMSFAHPVMTVCSSYLCFGRTKDMVSEFANNGQEEIWIFGYGSLIWKQGELRAKRACWQQCPWRPGDWEPCPLQILNTREWWKDL